MKKCLFTVMLVLSICALTQPILAEEEVKENTMATKLKRGAINIVSSPLEIPKQIKKYHNEGKEKGKNGFAWLISGTVKGIANTIGRIGSGVWDVVTFNVEKPANYEPLMKPDYVTDEE